MNATGKPKAEKRHLNAVELTALNGDAFCGGVKGLTAKTILTGGEIECNQCQATQKAIRS